MQIKNYRVRCSNLNLFLWRHLAYNSSLNWVQQIFVHAFRSFPVRLKLQRFPLQKFGDTCAMTDQEILNFELLSFKFQMCFENAAFVK